MIGVCATYFCQFHYGLARESSEWSNFATYLSGLVSPFLALVNILVFIDLTKTIERSRQVQEQEKDQEQERRHQKDIEHQKHMLIFQLRVEEIRRLDNVLENTFSTTLNECTTGMPLSMIKTITYLDSFLNNKLDIFDFSTETQKKEFVDHIVTGHRELCSLMKKMKDIHYQLDGQLTGFLKFKSVLVKNLYNLVLGKEIVWEAKEK